MTYHLRKATPYKVRICSFQDTLLSIGCYTRACVRGIVLTAHATHPSAYAIPNPSIIPRLRVAVILRNLSSTFVAIICIFTRRFQMSGLEVAGLVLGAFPIAIEVLGRYKEVARRLGFWYKIAAEHKKCDSQLKYHQIVYVSSLKRLLLPLAGLDDARIDKLLDSPGGKSWTEARTAENLEKRLGDSHEIYLQCMDEFHEWLKAINRELAFDVTTKQPLPDPTPAVSSMVTLCPSMNS